MGVFSLVFGKKNRTAKKADGYLDTLSSPVKIITSTMGKKSHKRRGRKSHKNTRRSHKKTRRTRRR